MGDRKNPIKFGPEWLRNLSRERNGAGASNQTNSNQFGYGNAPSGSGAAAGAVASASGATPSTSNPPSTSTSNPSSSSTSNPNPTGSTTTPSKVLLAKLRYGREEMLAMYDRSSEAPQELKHNEFLYQPRGKPPFALNNTFEDDMTSNMRSGLPTGNASLGERFSTGRGLGRGLNTGDSRGRSRMPFVRQTSGGRGSWLSGGARMPTREAFGGGDEEPPQRPWGSSNGAGPSNRNSNEQPEWAANKMYRNKRQGQATNWRQSRDDNEEWRSSDSGRSRSQHDKWERDWGEKSNSDKPEKWSSNRRTWVGGDSQNDDLPEWAVENAEACGGTFDSSGAFHGYSNDDSNLPKQQENPYSLTRSHTHGNIPRSKHVEEGSEEWWASEKAKKLSPKKFDASDIQFNKKPMTSGKSEASTSNAKSANKEQEAQEKMESTSDPPKPDSTQDEEKFNKRTAKVKFSESKTFDSLMRSDINLEEANDERGNFQSVMITPNNSLRQKHQNIVTATPDSSSDRQNRKPAMINLISPPNKFSDNEYDNRKQHSGSEDKIVEEIFDMTLEDKEITNISKKAISTANTLMNPPNTAMSSGMVSVNSMAQMGNPPMQMRISSPVHSNQGMLNKQNMAMPTSNKLQASGMQGAGIQGQGMQAPGMQAPGMQGAGMQVPGIQSLGIQGPGLSTSGMQQVSMTNSALNASLGLPIGSPGPNISMQMQGVPPPMLSNSGMSNPGMGGNGMSNPGMGGNGMSNPGMGGNGMSNLGMSGSVLTAGMTGGMQPNGPGMGGFPTGLSGMATANLANNSLFMNQNNNNGGLPNHPSQNNIFGMHGLQHSASQTFGGSMYGNMMPPGPNQGPPAPQNLGEQWYYEDPKKIIQGPFSSKEMYNWYRAGFFTPSLMVRRACDTHMRPLGSYGLVVPFAQIDVLSSYPIPSPYEPRSQGPHESMMNTQQGLGLESVFKMNNNPPMDIRFGSVEVIVNPPFARPQQMVDSLWSQPPNPDMLWMQQTMNARNEARVNNLPMYFWDQQPTAITSNSLLPEEIAKEMKTEDQILAQIRASQNINAQPNIPFNNDPPEATLTSTKAFPVSENIAPNLEELQKLIQKDIMTPKPAAVETAITKEPPVQLKSDKPVKVDPTPAETTAKSQPSQTKPTTELKSAKQAKNETEKAKTKENTKGKGKKTKEEKKEEVENKKEEEAAKVEKRSQEQSPTKNKKEEKLNKKELEKEKKEWLKEGFTIVKGSEKGQSNKEKKKAEEAKAVEEAERKKKEEEKLAAEEEKKKKQAETKKQQEQQSQRQTSEPVIKKAPWSAVANQSLQATNKDGLTLAEIQRLEREKKLEQMKEQHQMMQIIAQQQAAQLAREQEMQAGLGWAKKKGNNLITPGQSLAEIQAEARKQAVAAALAAGQAQALEESHAAAQAQAAANHVPWGNSNNTGGGFWDTQPTATQPKPVEKPQEPPKVDLVKTKKKPTVVIAPKKESSPAAEFETWCTTVLTSWSSKIDVPTFVGFLKDIESPYEVKDYVKCYLGESKDSSDFSRQFLERRSKLLRVGMVTPSDDLCSPAIAVNPRTVSGSDYQEVKGKGKKTKKNKMLKVDARILGFSVTAAEDRINVGDIDTV